MLPMQELTLHIEQELSATEEDDNSLSVPSARTMHGSKEGHELHATGSRKPTLKHSFDQTSAVQKSQKASVLTYCRAIHVAS